jgi:integrase
MLINDLLEQYHRSAVSRGLRPRSIACAEKDLRRLARETGARRLADLNPAALQTWVQECHLKPVTLGTVLRNAACVFSRMALQSMGMTEVQNPFAKLVRPKLDREAFPAPPRAWITRLMRRGIRELSGDTRWAFALALGGGLRWGEIILLSWEDVQTDSIRVTASKAKGRRTRVVPVSKLVGSVLEPRKSQGTVISGDPKEVHESLCAWLRNCGVKDAKPVHYLRKCYGSLAVADHGIYVASKLLGHSSITLTASTYAGQVDELPAVKF